MSTTQWNSKGGTWARLGLIGAIVLGSTAATARDSVLCVPIETPDIWPSLWQEQIELCGRTWSAPFGMVVWTPWPGATAEPGPSDRPAELREAGSGGASSVSASADPASEPARR